MRRKFLTELPKNLQNSRSSVKLSYTIGNVTYFRHNTMNKNFDRLALLYKISYIPEFSNNSSFISTASYQQILPDYKDLITSL